MDCSSWATQEHGAAAHQNAFINASCYCNHSFNSASAPLQEFQSSCPQADAELSEFIRFQLDVSNDLNFGTVLDIEQLLSYAPFTTVNDKLIHGSGDSTSLTPPLAALPSMSSTPVLSSMSSPPAVLQESGVCSLGRQVYERSPSLTSFCVAPSVPLNSNVVHLHYLPPAQVRSPDLCGMHSFISVPQHQFNGAAFTFPIEHGAPSDRLLPDTHKPSASHMGPLASATYHNNNQNADAPSFVSQGPKLIDSPGSQSLDQTGMSYSGAFSDSETMEFSSASAAAISSLSYFEGMNQRSAPLSPSSSVNMGTLHESFHNVKDMSSVHGGNGAASLLKKEINKLHDVKDMSSVHGGNGAASILKTEIYKLHDKFAWRKHGPGEGGIDKRRKYARRRGPSALPTSIGGNIANQTVSDPEESHYSHEDSRVLIRVKTEKLDLPDGYVWRKYGEKVIKQETHSRHYLRCYEYKRSGCPVQKRTQRASQDEDYVEFLYLGRHNHPAT